MPGNENFGAIVFDRPESLDRGWYCLGEGEPGRLPDDGAAGLPPGPVWYTSLSFSEAAEMGLSSSSRFLNSAYLRQPMQKLLARLGVPDDDAGEQARVASVLFSRVMNACRSLSGRQDFLPARFLKGGLRVLMDPAPDPCVLKEDAERLDNALSYSHRCLTPGPRSASPVWQSFSALPLAHAKAVLETPLPDGDFRPVPGDSLPPRGSGRAAVRAWLDAVTEKGVKPGLFRCEARAADASVRLLLNAGGTSGSGWNAVSMQRLWMTGPELTLLAGHADVDVFEARVSKPAGAPFLYAADQALLFPAAVKADSLGFEVQGWSSGMVRINTAGAGFPELEELCAKACLLPPVMRFDPAAFPPPSFSAGSPGGFLRAVEEDPSRGPEALRRLLFSGDLAAVLKLDRLILEALLEKRESGHAV